VLPGQILKELILNDRIVGGVCQESSEAARDFYASFVTGSIFLTDSRTAEMAKLTENAFRDVNIAFANELSLICDKLNINVWNLIDLANHHPRVKILQPGPGVGGHCIAVDPWFIVDSAPDSARLIRAAREVNDSKPGFIAKKALEAAKKFPQPVIACLGLTFKANVDDLRSSPAIEITEELARHGHSILAVEPHIEKLPQNLQLPNVRLSSLQEAVGKAHVVVLLVDHSQFRALQPATLGKNKAWIDTRGLWK
jgi:UDP-N-acetyl-D-mannosaminuronic acid dehydrogenase